MKNYLLLLCMLLYSHLLLAVVNINTADQQELMTLSGIGQSKSEAIINYRTEHGKFKNTEEIKQVKGIGDGIFAKIKDDIVIKNNHSTIIRKNKTVDTKKNNTLINKKQVTKITQ